jgi:putative SOS response-associated peptidase YedK
MLINAQSETVASKKTFASAFAHNRCLVPCSGWFEWRDEGNAKKQKYLFSYEDNEPAYMAGILYLCDDAMQLVTLTTAPKLQHLLMNADLTITECRCLLVLAIYDIGFSLNLTS